MNPPRSPLPWPMPPYTGGRGLTAWDGRSPGAYADADADADADAEAAELPVVQTLAEYMAVVRAACQARHVIAAIGLGSRRKGC